jgi:hypothetical protein
MQENPWARLLVYVTGRINQELLYSAIIPYIVRHKPR